MVGRRQNLPGQHRQSLFAADFTRVDIADGQHDELAGSQGFPGRMHRRIGHNQQGQRTSLRRFTELGVISIGIALASSWQRATTSWCLAVDL